MSEGEPTTMSGKIKLIAIVYVRPMEWNEFTLLHLLPTLLTLSEWRPALNIWSLVPSCPVVVMTIPQMNFPKINATKGGGGWCGRFHHKERLGFLSLTDVIDWKQKTNDYRHRFRHFRAKMTNECPREYKSPSWKYFHISFILIVRGWWHPTGATATDNVINSSVATRPHETPVRLLLLPSDGEIETAHRRTTLHHRNSRFFPLRPRELYFSLLGGRNKKCFLKEKKFPAYFICLYKRKGKRRDEKQNKARVIVKSIDVMYCLNETLEMGTTCVCISFARPAFPPAISWEFRREDERFESLYSPPWSSRKKKKTTTDVDVGIFSSRPSSTFFGTIWIRESECEEQLSPSHQYRLHLARATHYS